MTTATAPTTTTGCEYWNVIGIVYECTIWHLRSSFTADDKATAYAKMMQSSHHYSEQGFGAAFKAVRGWDEDTAIYLPDKATYEQATAVYNQPQPAE